jgi:hypothetical protein
MRERIPVWREGDLPEEGLNVPEDKAMAPGATPPAESSVAELGAPERRALRYGWGPAPVIVILAFSLLFAAGLIAAGISLML